ncbi:carbapenem self-resistance protein CarG family protein [Proteus hauseri]|uniref:carbapenem self-resistance protein CarG family protein n=1 Tax=Proteus hauseri TaxID=183417 RepID=UPI0032DBAEBF
MNKIKRLGVGVLFTLMPFTAISSDIGLEYGVNLIDFNGDGVKDIVIKSRRALNSTTTVDMVTVYIKGNNDKVYIVPSIYANALSLYDNKIKDTNIKISNFKFIEKNDYVILLSLEKSGNNLLKPTPVRFSSYTIAAQENNNEELYRWKYASHCVTEMDYLSVDDALSDSCFNKIISE